MYFGGGYAARLHCMSRDRWKIWETKERPFRSPKTRSEKHRLFPFVIWNQLNASYGLWHCIQCAWRFGQQAPCIRSGIVRLLRSDKKKRWFALTIAPPLCVINPQKERLPTTKT